MPQHSQDHEKSAKQIASEALERIFKENLLPVPQNFELWYVYYAKSDFGVVHALDLLVQEEEDITNEACNEIYQRFLSQAKHNEQVRLAGDQIQETIKGVKSQVSDIRNVTSEYNLVLKDAASSLDENAEPVQVKETLRSVLSNTQGVLQHNQKLEAELERSTVMMQELQRDLEVVRQQALTDGLTNLANRKAFESEMARMIDRAEMDGEQFCLVLMDIDYFKAFNDNYGHQVGDQVLRLVAQTLIDGVKGRDVAARYGGEEFAILLSQTDLSGGLRVADSLRTVVGTKELINRNSGESLGRVTLSGGVAAYKPGEMADALIERADAALYAAKHNGRDQIAAAPTSTKK